MQPPASATMSHGRARRTLWPSIAVAFLPFALLWLPPSRWDPVDLAVAGVLTLVIALVALRASSNRLPKQAPVVIAFAYLLVVVALRKAGGPSGVAPLALLPVFWLSLYGTRRQLSCLLVGVALALFVPLLLTGSASEPSGGWRAAILLVAVSAIVGTTLQSLVDHVRSQDGERERLLAELADLAHTDSLTGAANRRAWDSQLDRALARSRRTGETMSVALADIDSLKATNDVHGHAAGDQLLAGVVQRWSAVLRPDDFVARIGGDEFAVLLPACTPDDISDVLTRLRAGTPRPHSCSVGVATWDRRETADDLMCRADDALYRSKRRHHAAAPPALTT
jgi:diguanylate cyclase (GGDEF)-like protein